MLVVVGLGSGWRREGMDIAARQWSDPRVTGNAVVMSTEKQKSSEGQRNYYKRRDIWKRSKTESASIS